MTATQPLKAGKDYTYAPSSLGQDKSNKLPSTNFHMCKNSKLMASLFIQLAISSPAYDASILHWNFFYFFHKWCDKSEGPFDSPATRRLCPDGMTHNNRGISGTASPVRRSQQAGPNQISFVLLCGASCLEDGSMTA